MKRNTRLIAATCILGSATAWLGTAAASEPENFIKYRQTYMKALAGHTGSAAQIVRGKVDPAGHLKMHADAMAALSKDILMLFPEGSDFGETEAKEVIWEDWADFEKAASAMRSAADKFAESVDSADEAAIGERFEAVGKACKGCHKKFRQEEE
jgi:cytochrome c556